MMRITLHINADEIGDYEVRNLGEVSPGECRYSIRPIIDSVTREPIANVFHYTAQGAESLASKAMQAISSAKSRVRSTS